MTRVPRPHCPRCGAVYDPRFDCKQCGYPSKPNEELTADDLGLNPWGQVFYPELRPGRPVYLSGAENPELRQLEVAGYDVGLMMQPGSGYLDRVGHYRLWAADNGCFTRGDTFDEMEWLVWLNHLPRPDIVRGCTGRWHLSRRGDDPAEQPKHFGCLFATVPDVVGDAEATWQRSEAWLEQVKLLGFPTALVAQDGAEGHVAMWDEQERWDCLFIGGSTEWKNSQDAADCIHEARLYGKWVHVGRVNSGVRFNRMAAHDVDSVDGTFLAFGPRANAPRLQGWLDNVTEQLQGVLL